MATAFSDNNTMIACLNKLCSLEPEELILNDLLQDKAGSPSYFCGCCDEHIPASSHCRDCNEMLCDKCVSAHIRVKFTKAHSIVTIDNSVSPTLLSNLQMPNSNSPTNLLANENRYCDEHITEIVRLYCDSCFRTICRECTLKEHRGHSFSYLQDAIENAQNVAVKLLSEAVIGTQSCIESIDLMQRAIESLNLRAHTVARDVRAVVRKCQVSLEERERELLAKLEKLRILKQKYLQVQLEGLKNALSNYSHNSEILSHALEGGIPFEILKAKDNTYLSWKKLLNIESTLRYLDDDFVFSPPDASLFVAIANLGEVSSSAFTPTGGPDILLRNISERKGFSVLSKNCVNDDLNNCFSETLSPFLTSSDSRVSLSELDEHKVPLCLGGNLYASYRPKIELSLPHPIMPRNKQLCPLTPIGCSRTIRDYRDAGCPQLIFGTEGDEEGQLCRPWGVCCDPDGNIIVADRSNNRIQMFSDNGSFIRNFGSHGSEQGQFDRPAGVATDNIGRIVVTDKDNHRVQVFTPEGQYIFMFGEKGSKIGQFNYPWDVAVDSKGRIVVSDTRNHRIQLFTSDGVFLHKYGFENTANMWKHFDSPRGVCFGWKGCVIVTDFNNHRLVVIDPNFQNARFLGSEGSGVKQFLRPQGVTVDIEGNIIVADSRNNRIQIFEPNGSFLWQFGSGGKEPGQLDRPSGVCLTHDGKIVVVDFGNNRIQIF